MYDTGLCVGELVAVDVRMLRERNTELYLPSEIQKDYPNNNSPTPKRLGLSSDTTRLLSSYLSARWKDSETQFPSRSSDRTRPRVSGTSSRRQLHQLALNWISSTAGAAIPTTSRHTHS